MVEITIDELAQRAGTRTSTIRMYQTRGLLHAPRMRGRVGIYDDSHLTRLRLIARLQERGYSLAAIKDLADGVPIFETHGEPTEITPDDLIAIFPGGEIDPAIAARAMAMGLLAVDDTGRIYSSSARFLKIGKEMAAHGVPAEVALDQYAALAEDVRRIATRFVELFERFVMPEQTPTPQQLADIGRIQERLRGMAAEAVQELMANALNEAAREAVERHARITIATDSLRR